MKLLIGLAVFVFAVVMTGSTVFAQTATNTPSPTTSMSPTPTSATVPSGAPSTGRGGN